jgi:hypothetical protein
VEQHSPVAFVRNRAPGRREINVKRSADRTLRQERVMGLEPTTTSLAIQSVQPSKTFRTPTFSSFLSLHACFARVNFRCVKTLGSIAALSRFTVGLKKGERGSFAPGRHVQNNRHASPVLYHFARSGDGKLPARIVAFSVSRIAEPGNESKDPPGVSRRTPQWPVGAIPDWIGKLIGVQTWTYGRPFDTSVLM